MTSNSKQNTYVVIAAVGIVLISALVTAAFSSGLLEGRGGEDNKYRNITFTDATLRCEEEVDEKFRRYDSQRVLDNHSSRFENAVGLYKIFFNVFTKRKNETAEYYVSCFVRSRDGRIDKFEVSENKEAPKGEAIKKHSDKFIEWPQ